MNDVNQAALDFLMTRRSRPAKTLTGPAPSRDQLMTLLTAAARTPDHGKLEPWRFVVIGPDAYPRMTQAIEAAAERLDIENAKVVKAKSQFEKPDVCVVAVIFSPKESDKVPEIEQLYSAGAVCLALVNAGLASGWGANWLSGWFSHDDGFCKEALDMAPGEKIAGLIHLGTEMMPPRERERPDLEQIVNWMDA